jgi:Sulfotransferase family
LLLAQIKGDDAEALREASRMASGLEMMGALAMPEHRIAGHFELASFWRGRHDAAAAFAHWRAGHALLSQSQPFSREAHLAFVEASTRMLNPSRFESSETASNRDPTPVFIVGMPRSGTTLCEQIIAAHPRAFGAGERTALGELLTVLGGGPEDPGAVARIAGLNRAMLDFLAGRYLMDLHALAPDADRIVDKMPGNYRLTGLAALLLPRAKFIHCVRDPRDIGLSIFTFRFHGMHGYAHDLADLGWTIGQQARLMSHWKAALPGRILTVALNDWIDDFRGTLERVLMHIGLEYDPVCVRFHERDTRVSTVSRAQVREPVNARGLDRWREYGAELEPLISELRQAGVLVGWDLRNQTSRATAAERSR